MQAEAAGTGDVDQNAARTGDAAVFQQGAADGLAGGFDGGIFAAADGRAHHGVAHADHGGLDVGEVAIDQAGRDDDVADALHGLAEQIVGDLEGLEEAGAFGDEFQQAVIGNGDDGIDGAREAAEALLGHAHAARGLRSRRAW